MRGYATQSQEHLMYIIIIIIKVIFEYVYIYNSLFFFLFTAKSLPLHCIVESIASIQASLSYDTRMPWKRRPNVETDSYVIIPAATSFCDIVNTALQRLGYSMDIANTARGKSCPPGVVYTRRAFSNTNIPSFFQVRSL